MKTKIAPQKHKQVLKKKVLGETVAPLEHCFDNLRVGKKSHCASSCLTELFLQ